MKRKSSILIGVMAMAALLYSGVSMAESLEEGALITVLRSDAGWVEKQEACRGLRRVGTQEAIPALAALLTDEKLSHMARFALEPMPYAEVNVALREALGKATGSAQAGVAISLGARRDVEATPALAALLACECPDSAKAAAGALGHIASDAAVKALQDFSAGAPAAVKPAVLDALLMATQVLIKEEKGAQAAAICEGLLAADRPEHIRAGAFRCIAEAQPSLAQDRLLAALKGDDALFRGLAAQTIAETSVEGATKQYADALPTLPALGQAALLSALADRGDVVARPAVIQAMSSNDAAIRIAAVKALGAVGDASDVSALVALLAHVDEATAQAARLALLSMAGAPVDAALAASAGAANPAVRAQLLGLLTDRMAPNAVSTGIYYLTAAEAEVRIAALKAVVQLGGLNEAPVMVAVAVAATDDAERDLAARALNFVCVRHGDAVLPVVLEGMKGATGKGRTVLMRTLSRVGSATALEALLAKLNGADAAVAEEAALVLGDWPNAAAAPHLLALVQHENPAWKDLGFRNYVRLAREEKKAGQKAEMLKTAMSLAGAKEDKWLVLAAWGTLPTKQSLDAVLPLLDDAEVQNEAASALIGIAAKLGKAGEAQKAQALSALNVLLEKCADESIKDHANHVIKELG